ncbi:fimbrial biogenesis outer membrane usher protein [Enterobacter cancerogenus]|uniref:Fimbrial biogenesis outer membrane usher protein n=1 Tax=Enterobacter cancerogenus TaxID=69218 RepID=A0A484WTR9_9ENTR|nr:fimbrial biogenesis outer membrane usher protein [Enterobacter cancerogenus]
MMGFIFTHKLPWRPARLTLFVVINIMALPLPGNAGDIEFNTDILDIKDKANIDLSRFSQAGYIMPGHYTMVMRINKDELPDQSIDWVEPENNPRGSEPCLTPELVRNIGFRPDAQQKLTWTHQGRCLNLTSLPGLEARGDLGTSTLYLSIPQAYLEYRAPNWDPPSLWDDGLGGVLFDYYASAQTRHDNRNGDSNTLNGNGTVGANLGAWRLRADWQGRYNRENSGRSASGWDWSRYYAYRALPQLGARLMLGETSLYSDIFDSFRFTGGSLQSDDNMLPPNLRGYAPEISGVAKTNARVIISQQGRVIQETQVAAGPFRIQDLNEMVSGEIDVRVEEQDGAVQTFKVNTASVPYLTRPGRVRYKASSGRPSDFNHHADGPLFATGEFSWGINNGWSLYGGGVGSDEYNAVALGIGRDLLALGALSLDVTQSSTELKNENRRLRGESYRLSYSKRFDETDSQVTFAGYRFSAKDFMSMGEFLDARRYGMREGNDKEMYTVTFNQQLRDLGLSAYVNYSHQTYWDRPANDRYTLTMSRYFDLGRFRNLSLSATMYRNRYYGNSDDGMYLSLSLPWGNSGSLSYNSTLSRDNNTHQVSYYDRINERDNYQISTGLSESGGVASGYYTHNADFAQVTGNASYQAGRYSSLSLSMQGGATATSKGAALHRTSMPGGTRMMLDTDGVPDIPVRGDGSTTRTNWYGKAVVADISSYYRNRMSIDLDTLPDDAEATRSVIQATLTEGAIGYRKFDVVSGSKAMATLRLVDGSSPPFGATVQNDKGQNVGIVSDDGSVYLSGIQPGGAMTVQWDGNTRCTLSLPARLPSDLGHGLLLPCHPTEGSVQRDLSMNSADINKQNGTGE